jgi:hypothetical protein
MPLTDTFKLQKIIMHCYDRIEKLERGLFMNDYWIFIINLINVFKYTSKELNMEKGKKNVSGKG